MMSEITDKIKEELLNRYENILKVLFVYLDAKNKE